jgi:hypothetical protein
MMVAFKKLAAGVKDVQADGMGPRRPGKPWQHSSTDPELNTNGAQLSGRRPVSWLLESVMCAKPDGPPLVAQVDGSEPAGQRGTGCCRRRETSRRW